MSVIHSFMLFFIIYEFYCNLNAVFLFKKFLLTIYSLNMSSVLATDEFVERRASVTDGGFVLFYDFLDVSSYNRLMF